MSGAIIPIHNPLQKKLTFKSGLIFDDYRNNMLEHGLIFKQPIINWLRRPASSGSGGVNQLSTPGAGYLNLAGHRSLKSRCRPNGEIYYGLSEKKRRISPAFGQCHSRDELWIRRTRYHGSGRVRL